ncbi:MAG: FHA domain-containing protein [Prochlorotrichaceae cyanobacterium]|jgi:pSer/pThr/pTyr-binding forkhead associated (FHA) protein
MSLLSENKVNVLVVEDLQGVRAFQLERILYKVGRSEQADIQILGKQVSRNHATLLRVPSEEGGFVYRLVDGDSRTKKRSSNGTYVNGTRIASYQLENNDQIVFAPGVVAKLFHIVPEAASRVLASPLPILQDFDPALRLDLNTYNPESNSSPTVKAFPLPSPPDQDGSPPAEKTDLASSLGLNPKSALLNSAKSAINPDRQTNLKARRTGKKLQHSRLGQFFLRTSALTEEQLEELLREQSSSQKRLGELLVEKGMISQEDLDKALENQQILLGDILVKHNYITQEQLDIALKQQRETFQPIGEIVVQAGWITAQEMSHALKEQHWRRNGFWFLD